MKKNRTKNAHVFIITFYNLLILIKLSSRKMLNIAMRHRQARIKYYNIFIRTKFCKFIVVP